LYMKDLGS